MSETVPEYAGCPWPVDPACLGDQWEDLDPAVQDRAVALASSTLFRLTGYRVGGCPIVVRPCKKGCSTWDATPYFSGRAWLSPHIGVNGLWINSCGCTSDCACSSLCEVALPPPVGEVYAVTLNGTVLDTSQYRVDGSTLVFTGEGDCPWPVCQDMAAAVGEEDTFAIEYLNSYPVDALGAYAAGVLAYEYAKACSGEKCRLPSNVTAITRSGVSMEIASGSFPDGFTGIREVDAYIATFNPNGLRQQTQVWSPDIKTPRVMR